MQSPQWERIAQEWAAKIESGELSDGDRIPSEEALAKHYQVSRQTAHRAVHELKLRGLVQRQRRLGTIVHRDSRRQAGLIYLIVDHLNDLPQRDLIRGVSQVLEDGYRLVLLDVGDDEGNEAAMLERASREAAGILIYPLCRPGNTAILQSIVDSGTPMVCVDRIPADLRAFGVVSNNYEASRRGMDALREAGHRRIAFFSGDNDHVSTIQDRYRAYQDSTDFDTRSMERWFPKSLEARPERLAQATLDAVYTLLHYAEPPTAIFCTQDCYAMAVLDAFERLRLTDRPDVLTYNDWPPMMLRNPGSLFRIVQNAREIGRRAAESLLAQIQGRAGEPETVHVLSDVAIPDHDNHDFLTAGPMPGQSVTNVGMQ